MSRSRRLSGGHTILFLIAIAMLILALTNPTRDDYVAFLTEEEKTGNILITELAVALLNLKRTNYILFSTFEMTAPGRRVVELGALSMHIHFVLVDETKSRFRD